MYVYIFTRFYSYRHCTKVCVYLQTQHICFLGSWFNIQHSTRLTAVNRRWKMEVAVTAHLLQRRFATQYQWQYFDLAIV